MLMERQVKFRRPQNISAAWSSCNRLHAARLTGREAQSSLIDLKDYLHPSLKQKLYCSC